MPKGPHARCRKQHSGPIAILFLLFLGSCTVVKQYPAGRPFVYRTNITVTGDFSITERSQLESRLKGQLDDSMRVRSLSKVFWSVLKKPPVYDSMNAGRSVRFMRALLSALGYFRDSIGYLVRTDTVSGDQYRTTVDFRVNPGKRVRIDSFAYNIRQPELQHLAVSTQQESALQKGAPFAKAAISEELDRLVTLFRNNGYMRFGREDLIGLWDTLNIELLKPRLDPFEQLELLQLLRERQTNPQANLEIRLRPGTDSSKVRKYYVGRVTIYPDITLDTNGRTRRETRIGDLRVISYRNMFRPRILPDNIYLQPGDLYDQRNYFRTLNRFNGLSAWRMANIEQLPRKDKDTADFIIRLSPAKKYSFVANLEGSRNNNLVAGNLFGIGVNLGLQNRNFARTASQASTNLRFGIET
ncbi:MAG: hypothetical protein RJA57_1333, partial [Bacteroidota bacterium]